MINIYRQIGRVTSPKLRMTGVTPSLTQRCNLNKIRLIQKRGSVAVKNIYREPLLKPNHTLKTCGGPKAIIPTTINKTCGGPKAIIPTTINKKCGKKLDGESRNATSQKPIWSSRTRLELVVKPLVNCVMIWHANKSLKTNTGLTYQLLFNTA